MRLDVFLTEKGYFDSRTKAKQALDRNEVFIDNKPVNKPSFEVNDNCNVQIKSEKSFVSLGGYKLNKALIDFDLNVKGYICADIGASTGGFTDCLLQYGADKVYSVDLNDTLLHKTLRENKQVKTIIKNARFLQKEDFNDKINLFTADLSFISESLILPVFSKLMDDNTYLIVLIKPQFENDNKIKFKNGIIKDKKMQLSACKKIYDCAVRNNLAPVKFTFAPINEEKNKEFLMLFVKNGQPVDFENLICEKF